MNEHFNPITAAFAAAAALTILLSTLLTYLKERFAFVHDLLTRVAGHHWVAHSLLEVALFAGLGFWFLKKPFFKIAPDKLLFFGIAFGTAVLMGMFL